MFMDSEYDYDYFVRRLWFISDHKYHTLTWWLWWLWPGLVGHESSEHEASSCGDASVVILSVGLLGRPSIDESEVFIGKPSINGLSIPWLC